MQHSATRQSKQKISPNLDNHWSKKSSFLCVQTNWVCPSGTQRFSKNDSDSSHWLWLESSHSVKNVTRAESSHYCIQRDSSRVRVTKNRDSSRVIDLSHAITGDGDLFLLLTFCQNYLLVLSICSATARPLALCISTCLQHCRNEYFKSFFVLTVFLYMPPALGLLQFTHSRKAAVTIWCFDLTTEFQPGMLNFHSFFLPVV